MSSSHIFASLPLLFAHAVMESSLGSILLLFLCTILLCEMLLSWLVSISSFAVFESVSCFERLHLCFGFLDASCDVIDPIFHFFVLVVICFHRPFQMKGCCLGIGRQSCCVRPRSHELVHSFIAVFVLVSSVCLNNETQHSSSRRA